MGKDSQTQAVANKGSSAAHSKLVDEILTTLGTLPFCRVWKNATGAVETPHGYISFGLKGSADIAGITSDGLALYIEVKTGRAILSKHQRAFMTMIERHGGRYYLARNADDIYAEIISLALPEVNYAN